MEAVRWGLVAGLFALVQLADLPSLNLSRYQYGPDEMGSGYNNGSVANFIVPNRCRRQPFYLVESPSDL